MCWNAKHSTVGSEVTTHSPSFLECEEGKAYNEKMQFAHTIIQDIYRSKTYVVEFYAYAKEVVGIQVNNQD